MMRELTAYERRPKKAITASDRSEAWWYAERGGIDLYVQAHGHTTIVRISKRQIKAYLRNMEPTSKGS